MVDEKGVEWARKMRRTVQFLGISGLPAQVASGRWGVGREELFIWATWWVGAHRNFCPTQFRCEVQWRILKYTGFQFWSFDELIGPPDTRVITTKCFRTGIPSGQRLMLGMSVNRLLIGQRTPKEDNSTNPFPRQAIWRGRVDSGPWLGLPRLPCHARDRRGRWSWLPNKM